MIGSRRVVQTTDDVFLNVAICGHVRRLMSLFKYLSGDNNGRRLRASHGVQMTRKTCNIAQCKHGACAVVCRCGELTCFVNGDVLDHNLTSAE